jgi:hypothetical protein
VLAPKNPSGIFEAQGLGGFLNWSPAATSIRKSLIWDEKATWPHSRRRLFSLRFLPMTVSSVSRVFDRLDLGNVFRPIAGTAFKPIGGVCSDRLARGLKVGFGNSLDKACERFFQFESMLPSKPGASPSSRHDVAEEFRSARLALPVDRQPTDRELGQLVDQLLPRLQMALRKQVVVDFEGEVVAGAEPAAVKDLTGAGKGRAVPALPNPRRIQALELLRKIGKAQYCSIKGVGVVEQMIERAELQIMANTFDAEKKALRQWLRAQPRLPKVRGKRKNEGQLPKPSTFDKNINSLRPIYQELFDSMRSKLAANSEVIAAA